MLIQILFTLLLLGCATLLGTISFLVSMIVLPKIIKGYIFILVHRLLHLLDLLFDLIGPRCEVQKFRVELLRDSVYHLQSAVISPISGQVVSHKAQTVPPEHGKVIYPSGFLMEGDIKSCAGKKVDDYGMIVVGGRRLGRVLHLEDIHEEHEFTLMDNLNASIQEEIQAVDRQSQKFRTQQEKQESLRQAYLRYRNNESRLEIHRERAEDMELLMKESLDRCTKGLRKLELMLLNDVYTSLNLATGPGSLRPSPYPRSEESRSM